jgi:pimeloyl-ACP methyl ester carboxylesterase
MLDFPARAAEDGVFHCPERAMTPPSPQHRMVETNGIRLHVAEMGEGPAVILCHGWPETWYSWRHQLPALAAAGFRALAPDMRGYGRSDRPEPTEAYSLLHIVGDMVGLLDALELENAVIVGHDWGAPAAWNSALLRPDRFRAVAGLSVPYSPRGKISLIEAFKRGGLDNIYMMYFQTPGIAEREFEKDVTASLRRVLYSASGSLPADQSWIAMVPPGKGLLDTTYDTTLPLPWLSAADLADYVKDFTASGFRGGFNWYRNLQRNWELMAPFAAAPIRQPALFVAGTRDGVLRMHGMRTAIDNLKQVLPGLRKTAIIDGVGHWVQQEAPEQVNKLLLDFLKGL